jgi:hypothetical protein
MGWGVETTWNGFQEGEVAVAARFSGDHDKRFSNGVAKFNEFVVVLVSSNQGLNDPTCVDDAFIRST